MERYSSYKPTSMQWLKEIPSHWEVEPFARHFSYGKGLPITKADLTQEGVAVISYGQVHSKLNKGTTISDELVRFVSPNYMESHPQCLLNKGDFVFADTSEDIEGSGNFAFNDYTDSIFAGYHTVVAKPKDLPYPKYHAYLFQSLNWKSQIQSLVNGVKVYSIGKGHLKKSYLLLPPLAEQEKIVKYLDGKTSKIDTYVADKEKEIQLLQELKQKTIAEAVTKGLNPIVKMKDSGISWIGMIPEHWVQYRFATLFKEKSICNCVNEELLSVYLDRGVIRFSEDNSRRTNPTSKDLSKYQLVDIGNFVLNNQQAWRGSVGVSKYRGIISPAYFIFTISPKIDIEFANYLLRSTSCVAYYHLCSKGIGSIQRNLDWSVLRQKRIAIPPIDEQRSIVTYIEEKCQKIDTLITELQAEIDYLKEYKQRLIADVVTGQVNVQNEMI